MKSLCYAVNVLSPSGLASHPQLEEPFKRVAEASFWVAFLNRETTKRLEFHEISESRISWILLDSMEKSFSRRDPLRQLFFIFFRVFLFHFAFSRFKTAILINLFNFLSRVTWMDDIRKNRANLPF